MHDLTMRTVRRVRGGPRWVNQSGFGFESTLAVQEMPMVGLLQSDDGGRIAGRFFPSVAVPGRTGEYVSVILVFENEDPEVTRATILHEDTHFLSYICECKHVPKTKSEASKCRYRGEHSPKFYERLEGLYRACNVPLYAARMVEGEYPYPEHWNYEGVNESEWPAVP